MSKYYNTFFGSYINLTSKDDIGGITGSNIDAYADSVSREYGINDKIEHLAHLESAFDKPGKFFGEARENIQKMPGKILVKETYALSKFINDGMPDEQARKAAKAKGRKYYGKLMKEHNKKFPDSVLKSLTHAAKVKI